MAFTTLTFASLEVLSSTKMTQLYGNTVYFKSENAIPVGAWIFTPATAVVPIIIDQNYNSGGMVIDSEATTSNALAIYGKYSLKLEQDVSNANDGYGLYVSRNLAQTNTEPLVYLIEDNATSVQTVLSIQNDGSGNSLGITQNGNGDVIGIINNGSCHGILISQDDVLADNKNGLIVYSNAIQINDDGLVKIHQDNAGSSQDNLYILNDGTGYGLNIVSNYIGANNYVARFFHDGDSTNAAGLLIQTGPDDGTAATANRHITFADGNGDSWGYIQTSSSTTTYNASSDKRFKKNIVDTRYGLNDLLKLKVIDYNFAKSEEKISGICTGLAAQDVFEIYPEAVAKPNDETKDTWGIDYGRFTPLLIKAIQDQQIIIEDLKNRIGKLEK